MRCLLAPRNRLDQTAHVAERLVHVARGDELFEDNSVEHEPDRVGHCLIGDSAKARRILGWKPDHSFDDLVAEMVEADSPAALGKKLYG